MNYQLFSITFALFIILLSVEEKRRLQTFLTPFLLSAWPFVFIILLNNFLLIMIGYKAVTSRAQVFILVNLFLIWLCGFLLKFFFLKKLPERQGDRFQSLFADIAKYQTIIILIAWVIVIINFQYISSIIRQQGGIAFLGNQEFEDMMSESGIFGHLIELGKVLFILLIFTFKYAKSKSVYLLTLVALFFNAASLMVKYHAIWLLLFIFFFVNFNKSSKKQLLSITSYVFILFLAMNLFWFSLTLFWGTFSFQNEEVWNFFLRQFLSYFVSGPIVLDHWLAFGDIKPDWALFVVPLNIINVLMGNPERILAVPLVSHGFFEVAPLTFSNVGTSFGVYYLVGGYPFSFFMVSSIALISYILFYKSFTTRSKIIVFLNILFLIISLLNFFVQYFTLFAPLEMTVFFVLIIFVLRLLDKGQVLLKLKVFV